MGRGVFRKIIKTPVDAERLEKKDARSDAQATSEPKDIASSVEKQIATDAAEPSPDADRPKSVVPRDSDKLETLVGRGQSGIPSIEVYGDVEVDCRSDIYSLAATIYHLATGRILFPSLDNDNMMRAHCDESSQARDPRTYRPELSEGFCQLLESMLVKNRDYRIASWADVFAMCREIEKGVAFKPRPDAAVSTLRLGPDRV